MARKRSRKKGQYQINTWPYPPPRETGNIYLDILTEDAWMQVAGAVGVMFGLIVWFNWADVITPHASVWWGFVWCLGFGITNIFVMRAILYLPYVGPVFGVVMLILFFVFEVFWIAAAIFGAVGIVGALLSKR